MTSAPAKSSEPSIDDILASIRRIIADEQQAEAPPVVVPRVAVAEATDDVLDLAQPVMRPTGISKPTPVAPAAQPTPPQPEAVVAQPPQPPQSGAAVPHEAVVSTLRPKMADTPPVSAPAPTPPKSKTSDGAQLQNLIAGEAEAALSAAFGRISALRVSAETRTLEGLVADLLRPMLKDWLDANLPAIAERLVKQEIERIAAQSGR